MNKRKESERVHHVKLRQGEVVEQLEELGESPFSAVYKKGGRILTDVVKRKSNTGSIIAFLGERGSGKTTAMLSFLNAIEKHRDLKEKDIFGSECSAVRFVTFDSIDASMLEDGEDLFEIILAQMLVRFLRSCEDMNGNHRRIQEYGSMSELQIQFDKLFHSFKTIKGHNREDEASALATLKNLSTSSQLKQNFQALVDNYVRFLKEQEYHSEGSEGTYLVFAVDDLDMNIEKGFQMLGQIHRYILVKNVIILITAKYEQLEIMGRSYFFDIFERLNKETEEWKVSYLNQVTKQYLEKMLPLYDRIYLPDFSILANDYVQTLYIENGKNTEKMKKKDTILGMIAARTGVLFDGDRDVQHYMEPVSMRGLHDYYFFLNELDELDNDSQEIFLTNFDRFFNDFINRYVVERLNIYERQVIFNLLKREKKEWNKFLFDYVNHAVDEKAVTQYILDDTGHGRELDSMNRSAASNALQLKESRIWKMYQEDEPSIANVLWGICQCVQMGVISNELMQCVLILYSLIINREFCMQESRPNIWHAGSLGVWANYIFPEMTVRWGSRRMQYRSSGMAPRCRNNLMIILDKVEKPNLARKNSSIRWMRQHGEDIKALEILFLFFEGYYNELGQRETLKLNALYMEDPKRPLVKFTIENEYIDFNMFGFVKNLQSMEDYFYNIHKAIVESLMGMGFIFDDNEIEMIIQEIREDPSISQYREFFDWNNDSRGELLPFRHTDILVNLLMELHQWTQANLPRIRPASDIWAEYIKVIKQMKVILEKKEQYYQDNKLMGKAVIPKFVENFSTCPFIKYLERKEFPAGFNEMFKIIVERCIMSSNHDDLYRDLWDTVDTTENTDVKDL